MTPKYVVRTDDDIHAVRGKLIEIQGTVLPFHPYMVSVLIFLSTLVVVLLLSWLGGADWGSAFMVAVTSAAVVAGLVARLLSSDVGLLGLIKAERAELRWWAADRVDAVNRSRATRPGLLRINRRLTR